MEIIALQQYTDKYISLYEGQIRNVNKELAQRLIEKGVVAEHDEESGEIPSGGDSNLFLIHMSCRYVYGNPNTYTDYVVTEAIEDIKQAAIDKKAIVVLCDVTASGPPYPTTYMFTNLSYYIYQGFITITGSTNDLPNAKSGQITRTEIKLNGNDTLTTTIKEYRYSIV